MCVFCFQFPKLCDRFSSFQYYGSVCDIYFVDWPAAAWRVLWHDAHDRVQGAAVRRQDPQAVSRCLPRTRDAGVSPRRGPVCQAAVCVQIIRDSNPVDKNADVADHRNEEEFVDVCVDKRQLLTG